MDVRLEPSARGKCRDGTADHCGKGSIQQAACVSMGHSSIATSKETSLQEGPVSVGADKARCDCPLNCDDSIDETPSPLLSVLESTQTSETHVAILTNEKDSPVSVATVNGAPPICTAPSASVCRPGWASPRPPNGNGTVRPENRCLPSTSTGNGQHSLKTTAAQIQQVSGDDCCVHCILACLFCELLSLCSVLTQCLACGRSCEALCCCEGGATGGVACGEESCSAALDCGILEDCCEASDCLEICLECCSICFPT